ncbi:hypothetical protein B0H11DRAFT_1851848 [Mycena galericulata]|nr:hypothetical protein B0H11DRAFT_1851848 [Mycena galericulata]
MAAWLMRVCFSKDHLIPLLDSGIRAASRARYSRPCRPQLRWHTSANSTSLIHPFSTHLSLPYKLLLDNVISRFFTWHLVRRYPLIFGRWCQQLDVERPYFDKIFRSISNIIARSPNPSFRKKCTRMLATLQDQQSANFTAATSSLATYFGAPYEDFDEPALTDQEAFSLSMEIRYRTCLRRPQFKVPPTLPLRKRLFLMSVVLLVSSLSQGTSSAAHADDASDDEDLSQDMSLLTPDSSQRFDETFLWQGAPVSTTFDDLSPTLDGADLGFGFDLPLCLASPVANIECCPVLDMGMEIEYQDPSEVWSDIDIDSTDDNDLLNLSSDDEALFRPQPWDTHKVGSSLVTPARYCPTRDLRLLDVNTNDEIHADESQDALWCPSLSPPEGNAGSSARQGAAGPYFPGLSMDGAGLDLDLYFDSDYSDSPSGSDEHTLEDFADVISPIRDTCAVPKEELEHQIGNGSKCTDPETEDGADEMDGEDDIGLLDEDW